MTHQNPGSERVRGTAVGKRVQGNFGGGVLGLPESGAVVRAFEDLSVKVNGGLEPRRVIRTLSDARVRRQIETAPLRQLLKLVLVHLAPTSLPPSLSLFQSVASLLQSSTFPVLETGFLTGEMPPGSRSGSESTVRNERKGADSDGSVHRK